MIVKFCRVACEKCKILPVKKQEKLIMKLINPPPVLSTTRIDDCIVVVIVYISTLLTLINIDGDEFGETSAMRLSSSFKYRKEKMKKFNARID
jgi:hypothetical protein